MNRLERPSAVVFCCTLWTLVTAAAAAQAAAPSAEQALKLQPIQRGVDCARPTAEEAAKCTITAKKFDGKVGWVVEDANGLMLRKFVDTNGDNVVDQWSYYKDGIEVYRDIDSDFNGKVDQYRWFNTGGTRWGVSKNQDGRLDSWKQISAEEVSAEIVAALAEGNAERFAAVALTTTELKSLGLGKEKQDRLQEKIAKLLDDFKTLAAQQKSVSSKTQWTQFSAGRPGTVPAGTDGSTQDLRVYENVLAVVETAGKNGQVQLGTLVQVGDGWRAIDLPQLGEGSAEAPSSQGNFFHATYTHRTEGAGAGGTDDGEKLLAELQKIDEELARAATAEQKTQLTARRAEIVEKIAAQVRNPQDRTMWIRQLADMISAAVQTGTCPDGAKRLETLFEKLDKAEGDKDLAAYVKFRQLSSEYALAIQSNGNFAKIQTEWLKKLEQYVADYPKATDAAEAMLQLGIAQEFAGQEDEAKKWYARIVKEFAKSPAAQKAYGAETRLDSVGKVIAVSGKGLTGGVVDLAKFRGKVVLIQYWATWCEPAKNDMAVLKEMMKRYGGSFAVLGVNLDTDPKALNAYLAEARLPWPQIFEEGGLDSRPANQLGILTLPTMILVDQQGKVVDRNIQANEIDAQLKKLIK